MIRISKIMLKNFKSFKRLTLPIPEGFTAIVGPNGSGKSNIVDAICFVLGRSSAKSLRAERFSDLIFNGGKSGKPAKEAEVSLFLDNSGREVPLEVSEIKITRRVDTTGNSVYRLNGRRTSRTEILDVLSYATIQPDGHNIVLQGDITGIIEMNPVERRGLIDEIAGIAEYDERKRKAMRELDKVSGNISQVETILSEVSAQLKKLDKEKTDAMRHEFLKTEIRKSKGIVLYSNRLELEEKIGKLNNILNTEERRTQRIQRHLDVLSLKLQVKKKELEKINTDIILKEETEQFSIFKEIEKVKNELLYIKEKLENTKQKIEELDEGISGSRSGMAATTSEIERCRQEITALLKEKEEIEGDISKIKGEINKNYEQITDEDKATLDMKERLASTREHLEKENARLFEIEKANALLLEKRSEKERIFGELKRDIEDKKARFEDVSRLRKDSAGIKTELETALRDTASLKRELIDESMEIKKRLNKVQTTLQLKYSKFAQLDAKHKTLQNMSQKKLTFNRAIDAVLKLRDSGTIKGIHGTISELGKSDPKFSKALEIAAGSGLKFIVVEDENVAEKCINYLKDNHIGRATFLPLNKLKIKPPDRQMKEIARKSLGFAVDLVDFDGKFEKAFSYIFKNTVIIKDIPSGRKAGFGKARMVTIDGDLIEISGSMSGGFYRPTGISFEEIDASKKELETLKDEITALEKERDMLIKKEEEIRQRIEDANSKELEGQKEREILKERIRTAEETYKELSKLIAEREVMKKEISKELDSLDTSIAENEGEIKKLQESVGAILEEKNAIQKELEESMAEKILKEIKELEKKVFDLEKEKERRLNQVKLNESRIEEILKPKFSRLEKELLESTSLKKSMETAIADITARKKELDSTYQELKEKESSILTDIKKLKVRRDLFVRGINLIDRKMQDITETLSDIARKSEDARIEKARLESKLEEVTKALKQYTDLEIELLAPIDTEELENEITKMEVEMESLEPINMRAIEDFDIVKEKHDRLNLRVEKLLTEKDAILALMEEIEHRKKAVFMEVFENIAINFRRIFSRLSDGGTAELLLDEDAPLDGGLQIQARPAGKNPQYIELMSGGEKTLTALSFIFAIQRYQPAPFYIMDEIDMFLDDDNVKKISDLIKESSKWAQFIVVSLRENLMTSADQLFGVSNEEGISKLVGVELEQIAV